jgi:hypothetical protein
MKPKKSTVFLLILASLFFFTGCAEDNDDALSISDAEYRGSSVCNTCHGDKYATFIETGHANVLKKVSGAAPTYPAFAPGVPNPPAGYTWADISYVIGGFGWKARFIDNNGYIITGTDVQYNLFGVGADVWDDYDVGVTNKPYDCGSCHDTGWDPTGGNQDGLPGMSGTFAFAGVQCERCHGAGSVHVNTTNKDYITKNSNAAACGQCHYRTADHRILSSGGLIASNSQYDEFLASPHAVALTCVTCHDPHKTTKYNSATNYESLRRDCEDCHGQISYHFDPTVICTDCHMPPLAKSAIITQAATGAAPDVGDVKAHIMKINTTIGVTQFYTDANDGNTYSNGYLTLKYVCLRCHTDKDVTWAETNAPTIHTAP